MSFLALLLQWEYYSKDEGILVIDRWVEQWLSEIGSTKITNNRALKSANQNLFLIQARQEGPYMDLFLEAIAIT